MQDNVIGNRNATTRSITNRVNLGWYPATRHLPRVTVGVRRRSRDNGIGRTNPFLPGELVNASVRNVEQIGDSLIVHPRTIVVAVLVGLVVTVVAAIVPARRAVTVPPVAALTEVAVAAPAGRGVLRTILGAVLLVAGIGGMSATLLGDARPAGGAGRGRGGVGGGGGPPGGRAPTPPPRPGGG
jgi:hypothetical protein